MCTCIFIFTLLYPMITDFLPFSDIPKFSVLLTHDLCIQVWRSHPLRYLQPRQRTPITYSISIAVAVQLRLLVHDLVLTICCGCYVAETCFLATCFESLIFILRIVFITFNNSVLSSFNLVWGTTNIKTRTKHDIMTLTHTSHAIFESIVHIVRSIVSQITIHKILLYKIFSNLNLIWQNSTVLLIVSWYLCLQHTYYTLLIHLSSCSMFQCQSIHYYCDCHSIYWFYLIPVNILVLGNSPLHFAIESVETFPRFVNELDLGLPQEVLLDSFKLDLFLSYSPFPIQTQEYITFYCF